MTTLFLRSYDVTDGNSAKGVLSFPTTIQDHWVVTSQYMEDSGTINYTTRWMDSTNNVLKLRVKIDDVPYPMTVTFDPDIGLMNNLETIPIAMFPYLQQAADEQVPGGQDVCVFLCGYSSDTDNFYIQADQNFEVVLEDPGCTFSSIWGSDINTGYGIAWYSYNPTVWGNSESVDITNDQEYMEMTIAECSSVVCTSHNTRPTLICNLTGDELTGQSLFFPQPVNTITFEFKSPAYPTLEITNNKNWTLCLRRYTGS